MRATISLAEISISGSGMYWKWHEIDIPCSTSSSVRSGQPPRKAPPVLIIRVPYRGDKVTVVLVTIATTGKYGVDAPIGTFQIC